MNERQALLLALIKAHGPVTRKSLKAPASAAGCAVLLPDLSFLTLSGFIQNRPIPGSPETEFIFIKEAEIC